MNPPSAHADIPKRNRRGLFAVSAVWVLALLLLGVVVWWMKNDQVPRTAETAVETHPRRFGSHRVSNPKPVGTGGAGAGVATESTPLPVPAQGQALYPVSGEGSSVARSLVRQLVLPDADARPGTAEAASRWREDLARLVGQGSGAIPAIQEFLAKNVDQDLGAAGRQLTGYPTVRAALVDALVQIGGPQAMDTLRATLQNSADPRELALIARGLETLAPEQSRQEIVNAARAVLAMGVGGQLEGRDVGAVFEMLQRYGGAEAVPDLEKAASHWNYYAAISLAGLADGAGIPSLLRSLQSESGAEGISKLNALQVLAQVAPEHPEVRAAFFDQVTQGKIAANYWPYLTPILGGYSFYYQDAVYGTGGLGADSSGVQNVHIVHGNQNFYKAPGVSATPEVLSQQLAFVDELMLGTSDSAAREALQQAKDLLSKRLGVLQGSTP